MRILFVAPGIVGKNRLASFQEMDVDLLTGLGHDVRVLRWDGRPVLGLLRGAHWADLIFCWNISDHAYLASYLRRPLACVVGGYEFARLREFAYGNLISRRMRFVTKRVWRQADALLYVDPSLMEEATRAFGNPGRARYVPTGFDPSFWTIGPRVREDLVVTVGHAPSAARARLKGMDLFIETARECPQMTFAIVGELPPDWRERSRPPNVRPLGWMESSALRDLFQRSKVYCQLSHHEGLPNSMCEAMLCGCVPVGTATNGIPTAMGEVGFLVERNPRAIAEVIAVAASREDLRARARERIQNTFPVDRRRHELAEVLKGIASRRLVQGGPGRPGP